MPKKPKINFQTPVGVAKYPHLNKPDTAFDSEGKYKAELLVSQDEAKPLIKLIEDAAVAEHGSANYRVPYQTDEETGEVAFKLQSKYQPKFYDTAGQLVPEGKEPRIGGGSRLRLKGYLNVYKVSGQAGVSIQLTSCQIVEAMQGMNGAGFDALEEGGFTIDTSAIDAPFEAIENSDNFDF